MDKQPTLNERILSAISNRADEEKKLCVAINDNLRKLLKATQEFCTEEGLSCDVNLNKTDNKIIEIAVGATSDILFASGNCKIASIILKQKESEQSKPSDIRPYGHEISMVDKYKYLEPLVKEMISKFMPRIAEILFEHGRLSAQF